MSNEIEEIQGVTKAEIAAKKRKRKKKKVPRKRK